MGRESSRQQPHREAVGLVGVDLVGLALAEYLLAHGYDVTGFDIDPARCGGAGGTGRAGRLRPGRNRRSGPAGLPVARAHPSRNPGAGNRKRRRRTRQLGRDRGDPSASVSVGHELTERRPRKFLPEGVAPGERLGSGDRLKLGVASHLLLPNGECDGVPGHLCRVVDKAASMLALEKIGNVIAPPHLR